MKKKILVLFVVLAFVPNFVGAIDGDIKPKMNAKQNGNQLAALLPASNGVLAFDVKRLFNEALPQVLSSNPLMLNDIIGKVDEIKNKTGIDVRQFEQIAIGFSGKQTANGATLEPIILARGSFNAGALLALGKVAANGKYREEKIGDKSVYIFTMPQKTGKNAPANNKPAGKSSIIEKALDKMFDRLSNELAVAVYDNNTLAIGTLPRVRETLQSAARINSEMLSLINRKPDAILNFGAKFPNGLSPFINLDNDELGRNLDAIRQVSGSMDVNVGNAVISMTAKTLQPEQAQSLQNTIQGLQAIGKAFLGSLKSENKKVYGRMIDNAKIMRVGSEVTLDLQVPQSDIDILLSKRK